MFRSAATALRLPAALSVAARATSVSSASAKRPSEPNTNAFRTLPGHGFNAAGRANFGNLHRPYSSDPSTSALTERIQDKLASHSFDSSVNDAIKTLIINKDLPEAKAEALIEQVSKAKRVDLFYHGRNQRGIDNNAKKELALGQLKAISYFEKFILPEKK